MELLACFVRQGDVEDEDLKEVRITREAFAEAVLAEQQRLWAFALRLTRLNADAEDLLQLTYTRAFESWEQVRDLERVGAWMKSVMRCAFVDLCRRRARVTMESLEDLGGAESSALSIPDLGHQAEAKEVVVKALAELSPALAQAVTLRDMWGFSYEEIAELVGCPVGTVRSRISRARKQLLEIIGRQQRTERRVGRGSA